MSATSIESSGDPAVSIAPGTAGSQYVAVFDDGFMQRLTYAASIVALAELNSTTASASQVAYARQVLADPVAIVKRSLVFAAIADGVTNAGSTDQAIANRLGDIWPLLSKGYA